MIPRNIDLIDQVSVAMTYIHSVTKPTTARKTKKRGFMHSFYSVLFGHTEKPISTSISISTSKSSYNSADFGDRVFEVDDELRTEEDENDVVEVVAGMEEMSIGKVYQQIRLQALNSIGVRC